MIDLYLEAHGAGEDHVVALRRAVSALPSMLPCAWCDSPDDACLTVQLAAGGPLVDFAVVVQGEALQSWLERDTALAEPLARGQWVARLHGRILQEVERRVRRVPPPLQDGLTGILARVQASRLADALPVAPSERWVQATRGAVRVLAHEARVSDADDALLQPLWRFLDEPLWAPADRASLERVVWEACAALPGAAVRDGLAARASVARASGRYAASSERHQACLRRPEPGWVVCADVDVACFVAGALGGAFGGSA
ncbi:MAG: hypothetical protein KTR31_13550 [Myxococcales bacterium]|nr:hypothetical protein [Myxococcales bacterium]